MSNVKPISVETAAKLLMISPRHLQRLAKEGWIPKPYSIPGVVQGYIRWRDDGDRRGTASAARARADNAKTRIAELRAAKMEGDLISLDEHNATVDAIVGMFRVHLAALPGRFSRIPSERNRLEALVDDLLTAVSQAAEKMASDLEAADR